MFFLVYSFQSAELKNIVEGTLPAFKKVDSNMGFKNENTVASVENYILKRVPSHITPENSEFNDLNEKIEVKVMMNPLTKQLMEMKFDPDKAMAGFKQFFFRFFYKLSKFDTYLKMVFFCNCSLCTYLNACYK